MMYDIRLRAGTYSSMNFDQVISKEQIFSIMLCYVMLCYTHLPWYFHAFDMYDKTYVRDYGYTLSNHA